MPASNLSMIHKLQKAINMNGGVLLLDRTQFFSREQNRPVTMYRVCETVGTTKSGRRKKECLFETASQIQVVLFLRDYWFVMQGKGLPPIVNNKKWGEIRDAHLESFKSAEELNKQRLKRLENKMQLTLQLLKLKA